VSAQSQLIVAVALLASGAAMLLTAAALVFENGMIADATGGMGSLTAVEAGTWIVAALLLIAGVVALIVALRARRTVSTR
jgi:hypothetical protein